MRQYEVTAEQWTAAPFVVRSIWGDSEVDAIATDTDDDALDIARLELGQGYDVHIEQRFPATHETAAP